MAITFAVRGSSVTAFRAVGGAAPALYGTTSVDAVTASGVIGNSIINLDQGSVGQRALAYNGVNNLPTGQTLSILMRFALGTTAAAAQLFYFGGSVANWSQQSRSSGTGIIVTGYTDTPGGATLGTNSYTVALTTGIYYDFCWLIDGTKTSGALITYANGTAVSTTAGSGTRAALASQIGSVILLGTQNAVAQGTTQIKLNEFVIWDTIIDPTAVALANDTTASLNGSARTSFVAANALNGTANLGGGAAPGLGIRQLF